MSFIDDQRTLLMNLKATISTKDATLTSAATALRAAVIDRANAVAAAEPVAASIRSLGTWVNPADRTVDAVLKAEDDAYRLTVAAGFERLELGLSLPLGTIGTTRR